ncbi:MAG: hypothetical protein EOM44_13330 [Bacteroidia bacterium]|nr:hypothetical protein [Bacteroidia bacterium]
MTDNELIMLLNESYTFFQMDKQSKQEKQKLGENFNVFNILGLEYNEIQHSKFISELLNVNGKHCMGNAFLKEFLKIDGIFEDFKLEKSTSAIEYYVGVVYNNEELSTGGRLDIILEEPERIIVIENKIYASDQQNQLLRYYNHCKSTNKQFKIIYLTLNGDEPSEFSKKQLKKSEDYLCISYKYEILNWLEECVKLAHDKPFVRENLNQYIRIIKQLTNQDMNKEAQNKLFEKIDNQKMIESYVGLTSIWSNFKKYIINKHLVPSLDNLAKKHNLEFQIDDNFINFIGRETGFYFTQERWNNQSIFFWTENKDWRNFYVFINMKSKVEEGKFKKLGCFNEEPTTTCPYGWEYLDSEYLNWDDELLLKIRNGEYADYIEQWLERIIPEMNILNERYGIGGSRLRNQE